LDYQLLLSETLECSRYVPFGGQSTATPIDLHWERVTASRIFDLEDLPACFAWLKVSFPE